MNEVRPESDTAVRLHELPTWILSQAQYRASRVLQESLGQRGFRGYHYRVLAVLAEASPMSQIAISQRVGIDRSDMVALVNELALRGLVERAVDPVDRRRNAVALTAAGRQELATLDGVMAEVQASVLKDLDAKEIVTLIALLRRVAPLA